MFYPDRAWKLIAYPIVPVMIGFFIYRITEQNFGKDPIIIWLVMVPLDVIAIFYLLLLIMVEIRISAEAFAATFKSFKSENQTPQKIVQDLNNTDALPPIKGYVSIENKGLKQESITNEMAVNSAINWDLERNFAKALVAMAAVNKGWEKVDLTEVYWNEKINFRSRWSKLGGSAIAQLREIKVRWAKLGVLEKVNPNSDRSPYRIVRVKGIALIASGTHLELPLQP